jgi:hypothetical protein
VTQIVEGLVEAGNLGRRNGCIPSTSTLGEIGRAPTKDHHFVRLSTRISTTMHSHLNIIVYTDCD